MTKATRLDNQAEIQGVLFDLDGTLADTAPDLVAALNMSLVHFGYDQVSLEKMRPVASNGSLALVKAAIPSVATEIQGEVQQRLLGFYQQINGSECELFCGVDSLLDFLDERGLGYGVVTNKPARFTRPLISALSLTERMQTVISGDSTAHSKPHTAPMLLAAQQLSCEPEQILYLGDAKRDLVAASNSTMLGGVALWGYIGVEDDPNTWPAEYSFKCPTEIISLLKR